jgi:3-hydroxyisobutyrate dehydrogenase-like beta-hydroxyacid dehydrogenase
VSIDTIGFVGLGNMGSVLAGNLVEAGHEVMTHDLSGPGRSPAGAEFVSDLTQLARRADVVVFSLPDGGTSEQVATSEAIAFGLSVGLDMETMLEVIDASSGQSAASRDKFPNHVLTGRYAAGFANSLMSKDLKLYVGAVETQGAPSVLGSVTESVWEQFAAAEPGADFTRIFPFVARR